LLKIRKYLLFSIVLLVTAKAEILTWGGYSKTKITKPQVENIIKEYVDNTYPKKVQEYNKHLEKIKQEKIKSVAKSTFVKGTLMWQDTQESTNILLNQLEAKRYCKGLILAKRKDWRLPTYKELLEIVEYTKANPATHKEIQHIDSTDYWSDTQKYLKKKQKLKTYWYVNYALGESGFSNEMEKKNFRCVRKLSSKKDEY